MQFAQMQQLKGMDMGDVMNQFGMGGPGVHCPDYLAWRYAWDAALACCKRWQVCRGAIHPLVRQLAPFLKE